MTVKEFFEVKPGTAVEWRERNGEISDRGIVREDAGTKFILWPDGQRTDFRDDGALRSVEITEEL